MDLESYAIKHLDNTLEVYSNNEKLYTSAWFMEFGKFCSDVFNKDQKIIYTITKQFQFWKWKMVYHIKKENVILSELISQNNRKTIFSIDLDEITYEIKIHYKKRASVFKNDIKIAEFNEAFAKEANINQVELLLIDKKDLEISFLLYSCLKIGTNNNKSLLKSQKQLESNDEPWS